ncbi:MAG: NADH-quinone oxidoreductase subunit C [Planctomycetota bacterium]
MTEPLTLSRLAQLASAAGASEIEPSADAMLGFRIGREKLLDFLADLRDEPSLRFKLLLDVTGLDWSGEEPRFEVVYHLYSVDQGLRVRVKTRCPELDPHVPSATGLFPTADFHERETFDMFGIVFDGHPDLRRILMPDEFEHHPLRKEYPLEGIEPEKCYLMKGGVMMPRPEGAGPIKGAGSATP